MSVMSFTPQAGRRFIRAKLIQHIGLAALVGTRVYNKIAPEGAAYPYIVITPVNAEETYALNAGEAAFTLMLWQIEYWTRTNDDAVMAEGAALLNDALHLARGAISGATYGSGTVFETWRARWLDLPPETVNGTVVHRAGAEFYQQVKAA